MKNLVIGLFSMVCFLGAVQIKAQGLVEIIEDPDVASAVQTRIDINRSITKVKGYRVQIGYYNDRGAATREQSNALTLYGKDHMVLKKYDEPNWKVWVGEFEEKADAENFLRTVRKKYPGARIIEDIISKIPPPPSAEEE